MKKTFYILALIGAVACSRELDRPFEIEDDGTVESATVSLSFSVPVPPQTKALTEEPSIETMHVAVFNKNGYLKEFKKATFVSVTGNSGETRPEDWDDSKTWQTTATFSVDLTMATAPRVLHLIANVPLADGAEPAETVGEANTINSIIASTGQAVYWQRIEVDAIDGYRYNGISFMTSEGVLREGETYPDQNGVTVNKDDYIRRDGSKITNGQGYFASQALQDKLKDVPLVRNFAKILLATMDGANFTPESWTLVHAPTRSYIAPYDKNKTTIYNGFVAPYVDAAKQSYTDELVATTGYVPPFPSQTVDATVPTDADLVPISQPLFMFERPTDLSGQEATAVIVKGTLKGYDDARYFKIDIADENGSYFNIYRGMTYEVTIGNISGSTGKTKIEDAYNEASIGDVSQNPEAKELTQISDGKGTTLWVEYVDYASVNKSSGETKLLFYRVTYNDGTTTTYPTKEKVSLTIHHLTGEHAIAELEEGTVISNDSNASYFKDLGSNTSYTFDGKTYNTPNGEGWCVAEIPLSAFGDNPKNSYITVSAEPLKGSKALEREVNYHVIGTQNFTSVTATPSPLASRVSGETVTINITLPTDLGSSMFPLVVKIEALDNNLTTIDGLPVETGASLFDSNKNSFYFLKTINYSEYYDATKENDRYTTTFSTSFKLTSDWSDSNTGRIRVQDKAKDADAAPYFNVAEGTISVPAADADYFTLVQKSASIKGSATTASFKIRTNLSDTWNLSIEKDGVAAPTSYLGVDSGTGNADITVTVPANESKENAVTYTVTATCGTKTETFTLTQAALKAITKTVSKTVQFTYSDFSVASPSAVKEDVSITFDNIYAMSETVGSGWFSNTYNTIVLNQNTTVKYAKSSTSDVDNFMLTGATFTCRAQYYRPTNAPTNWTRNENAYTYNGDETTELSVTLVKPNNNLHVTGLTATYSYTYIEYE